MPICAGALGGLGLHHTGVVITPKHRCEDLFNGTATINFEEVHDQYVGSVEIQNKNRTSKFCKKIFIQFEATVVLQYNPEKGENDSKAYPNLKQSLLDLDSASVKGTSNFILSPMRQTLLQNENLIGKKILPFTLPIPKENLPAPFKSQYGSLFYQMRVYLRKSCCNYMLAEKAIHFPGYRELKKDAPVLEQLSFSCFNFKQHLEGEVKLSGKNFLPKEEITFELKIDNARPFFVKRVSASLVQKTKYKGNGVEKVTTQELDSFEQNEVKNSEQIGVEGKLTVPRRCGPSYKPKSRDVYGVRYFVQYKIEIAEHFQALKSEVEIIVGTTRGASDVRRERPLRRRITFPMSMTSSPQTPRRESIPALTSTISQLSLLSLPPNYSQLTSRNGSVLSFETLPPNYNDIE